jgi:hypothetical protein
MIDSKKILLVLCLVLAGCAGHKKPAAPRPGGAAAGPAASPTAPPGQRPKAGEMSFLKGMILSLARREWEFFGKQTVLFDGEEESIPHVGKWEDDEDTYVARVNWYWRAVGKPNLDGNDCRQPWSAAFVSWIMREAGVPEYQFPAADAHRDYLVRIVNSADGPDAGFVPHAIKEYQPRPGDLICATRGRPDESLDGLDPRLVLLDHAKLHCDIVVEQEGGFIAVIGGNVRNSVSKTTMKLDGNGFVQPTRRRPWFMVLENRL